MSFAVHHPGSIEEAVALARRFGPAARFIAGGTDLVIQINRKRAAPDHLIDINGLHALEGITETPGGIAVGALTTHKALEQHPAFQGALIGLVEAARVVGGHQVRNMGTVGGNVANASPAADVVVPLLALDAAVALVGPDGSRLVQLQDFLVGPGRTQRRDDELIESICFVRPARHSATAFLKAGRRKAMEISVVCVAAYLAVDDHGRCADVRIALGAVDATAKRASDAERQLLGQLPGDDLFRAAGQLAAQRCTPITDVRASAHYRRLLVGALVPRALNRCLERLGGAGP